MDDFWEFLLGAGKVVLFLAIVGAIFFGCKSYTDSQVDLATDPSKMPIWMTTQRPLRESSQPPTSQACQVSGSFNGGFFAIVGGASGSFNGSCKQSDEKLTFTWEVAPGRTMYSEVPLSIVQVVTDNSTEVPTVHFIWQQVEGKDYDKDQLAAMNPNSLVQAGDLKYLEIRISAKDKAREPALSKF